MTHHPRASTAISQLLFVLIILGTVIFFVDHRDRRFTSVEVAFSDHSASGLAIVPASCPSSPDYAGQCDLCQTPLGESGDSNGYVLSGGTANSRLTKDGYDLCIHNSSGASYFIPARTSTELQDFLNAAPNLNGVSQNPPN